MRNKETVVDLNGIVVKPSNDDINKLVKSDNISVNGSINDIENVIRMIDAIIRTRISPEYSMSISVEKGTGNIRYSFKNSGRYAYVYYKHSDDDDNEENNNRNDRIDYHDYRNNIWHRINIDGSIEPSTADLINLVQNLNLEVGARLKLLKDDDSNFI